MRARRFRPCVDFRPSLDLLMPRIAPSDITMMLISDPNPVPDAPGDPGNTGDPGVPTVPMAPIYPAPTSAPTTPATPVETPTVGC
jgi:hypothetical protein